MAARQKREAAEKPQRRRGAPARPPKTGIGMLLRDADTAFNRYLTAQLAAHGVTFGQFQHLRNLWVENGLTQAELSRRIGIEMASSTAILDSLEAAKLITRVRNTTDRRKINVFLTPAGRRAGEGADGLRRRTPTSARARASPRPRSLSCSCWPGRSSTISGRCGPPVHFPARRTAPRRAKARPATAPRGRVRRNMPRAAE